MPENQRNAPHDAFCGWYYRCQSGSDALALIPAVHTAGGVRSASLQIIGGDGQWNVTLPAGEMGTQAPRAQLGQNLFRPEGVRLNLREGALSAEGELRFEGLTPPLYDVMGPFALLPGMECRHSVASMRHRVRGSLCLNGVEHRFDDAVGYIEGDRGRSFPRHYAWTQCCFDGGSLMLAVAEIPVGPARFTGVVGLVLLGEREYRLATYLGARAISHSGGELVVRQGGMTLTARLLDRDTQALRAPVAGAMTRLIRENVSCRASYRFVRNGRTLLAFETASAAFEYEYEF